MKSPMYIVPKSEKVVSQAANFVAHVAQVMEENGIRKVDAA
jgi:hypothetical protein